MTTITEFVPELQTLFTRSANEVAKEVGFIQRQRQITGAGFAQALVFGGLVEPQATRKQVHYHATQAGLQVSVQGLDQRFDGRAVQFMRALLEVTLEKLVQAESASVVLPQFKGVYITDCTRLVWLLQALKLALRWEIQRGHLQACLTDLNQHDQKAEVVARRLPPGALHLGDLGFFKLQRFRDWNTQGVYWLTRYKVGTRPHSLDGQAVDLKVLLTASETVNIPVIVGCGRNAFTAQLVAAPLPSQALSKRMARLKEQARLDQRPLSQRQLELAHWTIYLTNVPELTFEQAHILARTRWQIENLFKLWKSHAHILRSRSQDPYRQLCEGYAKLIGIMAAHWTLLVAGWQHDRLGALDALRILRTHVPLLQRAFICPHLFTNFFLWLRADLALAPPLAKRRKTPLAFQLWRVFDQSYP